jgi:hypothetical protein
MAAVVDEDEPMNEDSFLSQDPRAGIRCWAEELAREDSDSQKGNFCFRSASGVGVGG